VAYAVNSRQIDRTEIVRRLLVCRSHSRRQRSGDDGGAPTAKKPAAPPIATSAAVCDTSDLVLLLGRNGPLGRTPEAAINLLQQRNRPVQVKHETNSSRRASRARHHRTKSARFAAVAAALSESNLPNQMQAARCRNSSDANSPRNRFVFHADVLRQVACRKRRPIRIDYADAPAHPAFTRPLRVRASRGKKSVYVPIARGPTRTRRH